MDEDSECEKKTEENVKKRCQQSGREGWKEERGRYEKMYNPCVLSLAVTAVKFSSTAELLCCFDLMNIHDRAEREGGCFMAAF